MTKLWDTHMHTAFSGDCEIPPEVMLNRAKELGLPGIIFTDHLDWDYPGEVPGEFDLEIEDYLLYMGKLLEIEAATSPTTELRIGLELGLQPHLALRHKDLLEKLPIDYCIGSVHTVHKRDPYYPTYFEGRDVKDAYKEYFECVLENLDAFSAFDSLGHLDYVVRYGKRVFGDEKGACNLADYKEIVEAIFKYIIKNDIALEVNTGAYRAGLTEPNPSFEFLKFYRECGGKLITIGADAHKPEHIGLHYDKIADELKSIGFKEYAVYRQHKAEMLTLQ